jgi:Zn-dependent alcohol dehydrogenase
MTATVNPAELNSCQRAVRVEPLALSDPGSGGVLVRMTASGLYHSDAGIIAGDIPWPLPAVLGHEGAGVVERVGPAVSRVAVNDTVVLSGVPDCGACFYCTRGQPALCERSATVWSAEPSFTRPMALRWEPPTGSALSPR